MNFETWFTSICPQIPQRSADAVLRLTAEGATIPFIARYRKEQTGNLDEVAIQKVIDTHEKWELLIHRQKHILSEIERQNKLTPELKDKILTTYQLDLLEDLYLPYKQKRKTKSAVAQEAGLLPLADWIWNCGHGTDTPQPGQTLEIWAFTFRNEAAGILDAEGAIQGAQDILVERISELQELRQLVRSRLYEEGHVRTSRGAKAKPNSKFENYFSYNESITSLLQPQNSHRYLAIRRGWMEEELSLSIGGPPAEATAAPNTSSTDAGSEKDALEASLLQAFETAACTVQDSPGSAILLKAARLALKAHVIPSIENEIHKALREVADQLAIQVFSENVRKLLMASPFGSKAVLGVDPGVRTGCKLALVDDSGKFLTSGVLHLQTEEKQQQSKVLLQAILQTGKIQAIAVGNGTAGRETEAFVRKALKELEITDIPVVMVNEAGASVYSASDIAREEFPDLDVTIRGAISIARRLQDPLAELVKIDPKSIGVGQYQHDVSQPALKRSLDLVVDSCVNQVGVNLNTASPYLLAHVSGIGPALANSIVECRNKNGLFRSRTQLQDVPRFSKKAFEQSAGFLRISEGEHPLDNTGVHPERYAIIEEHAKRLGKEIRELIGAGASALKSDDQFKQAVGEFTFEDIVRELEKPGRDPRSVFVPFQYREDIFELKDLQSGMICPGIVTNVTSFGAFVDIGVHQDGLVHLSQLANNFVKDPRTLVQPGDRVQVKVLEVNLEKKQISLSMRQTAESKAQSTRNASKGANKRDNDKSTRKAKAPPRPTPSAEPSIRIAPVQFTNGKPSHGKPASSGKPAQKRSHPPKPKPAFNNAFASLASMRNQLKPK